MAIQETRPIEDESIDFRRYLALFLSYWWLMLMLPMVGGAAAYYYSLSITPSYEAKTTVLVQYRGSGFGLGTSNFQQSGELAYTYSRQLTAEPFLSTIQLSGAVVTASTGTNPPVIIVKVRHVDPNVAANTAQIIAEEFINYAMEKRLMEIGKIQAAAASYGLSAREVASAQLSAVDSLSILEPVEIPQSPVVPRTTQNIVLGTILGLVVALSAALVIGGMEDTVKFPEKVEEKFGVPALGSVFNWSPTESDTGDLIVQTAPSSTYAESFRQFRANFEFATAAHPRHVYVISSPGPSEGKTTVITNLAVTLAQTGKKVLLVDGDLRRPSLTRVFKHMSREHGLSNYLSDTSMKYSDAVQTDSMVDGIAVIPSGPIPPNPGELLATGRLRTLIDEITGEYDYVLLDSPPLLPVADAAVIASQADGVMLVVDGQSTKTAALKASVGIILNSKSPILGVVINKLKRRRFSYGYGYGYGYQYYRYYEYRSLSSPEEKDTINGLGWLPDILARPVNRALSWILRR